MERNTKKGLAVGIAIVIIFAIISSLVSVSISRNFVQKDIAATLQKYQREAVSDKMSDIQRISECRGDAKEVKDLYLKGLLTEPQATEELKEILLEAEGIYPGITENVRYEIKRYSKDIGPDSEVTANIICNELNEVINDLIDEIFDK